MIYYKGTDGRIINYSLKGHFYMAKGELFTEKELEKRKINKLGLEIIKTPKNNTYKSFGERYVLNDENVKVIRRPSTTPT